MLMPPALGYLVWLYSQGTLAMAQADPQTLGLILLAGPVTTVPMLLFAAGVRMIPYSVVGIIQYLSPTIVFFIGAFCFDEPVSSDLFIGFAFIWTAVLIFAAESYAFLRSRRRLQNDASAQS